MKNILILFLTLFCFVPQVNGQNRLSQDQNQICTLNEIPIWNEKGEKPNRLMTQEELIVFNKAVKQIKEKNITFQVVFVVKYLDNFYLLCKRNDKYWTLVPKQLDN
jgi:hypothetical protein